MNIKNILSKSTPFLIGIACALIITGWLPKFQLSALESKEDLSNYHNIIKNNSFSHILTPVLPSVVSIYSISTEPKKDQPLLDDPLFQQQYTDQRKQNNQTINKKSNLGSGIILHEDGYILTNYHVIKGAEKITILLADGRETHAQIIGTDRETDLAVLKIKLSNLIAIKIEKNIQPKIGDLVFTIGNPYGVGQSVSMGILSATGRRQIGLVTYENYLQTDADINPGSSGGALINANGNLIGLNTALISKSGGSQGMGFSIPNYIAIDAAKQMIENGKVTRGFLGILNATILSVNEAQSLGIDFYAYRITNLTKNGPSQKAGILPGDILTLIAGEPILNPNHIREKIAKYTPGTTITVRILRDKQTYDIDIILGTREKE
ncbi:MAG: trypsin-like peptidase domain-containing protein [Saccharospirillaceae bacterium]|nr:trypsin-like peptidase domain-containing protein [Pseudomonadales bacterium]NRB77857.1 trypsin-like peptidase domain-containing protein [Saccharospirillaceae bacterium]